MSSFRIGSLGLYLARQNLFFMLVSLGVAVGIYLLFDIFDRIDDFVNAGLGIKTIIAYFVVKIPEIFSQLMPGIFFLALLIQLGLMAKNNEMLALRAGGISITWFALFFIIYATLWGTGQLLFSQYVGVYGGREARRIWKEEVRKTDSSQLVIKDVWFRDWPYIVKAKEAMPEQSRAKDVVVYVFDEESQRLAKIISAKKALVDENGWGLLDVTEVNAEDFSSTRRLSLFLTLKQDLKAFLTIDRRTVALAHLPLWQLGQVIDELKQSGSNVEQLRTVWHTKLAYAFSMVIVALMALAMITFTENIYIGVALGLVAIFVYNGVYMLGISMGNKGIVHPLIAAWTGNLVFGLLAWMRLAWVSSPRLERKVRGYFNRKVQEA